MSAIGNFFAGLLGSNKPETPENEKKNTGNALPPSTNFYNGPMAGGKRRKTTRSRKTTRKSASRKHRKNTRRGRK